MIIDTTQTSAERKSKCKNDLLDLIASVRAYQKKHCPWIGGKRTVTCCPGVLTAVSVHVWEEETGLTFSQDDWSRVVRCESEFLVMAEAELKLDQEESSVLKMVRAFEGRPVRQREESNDN